MGSNNWREVQAISIILTRKRKWLVSDTHDPRRSRIFLLTSLRHLFSPAFSVSLPVLLISKKHHHGTDPLIDGYPVLSRPIECGQSGIGHRRY